MDIGQGSRILDDVFASKQNMFGQRIFTLGLLGLGVG